MKWLKRLLKLPKEPKKINPVKKEIAIFKAFNPVETEEEYYLNKEDLRFYAEVDAQEKE